MRRISVEVVNGRGESSGVRPDGRETMSFLQSLVL